MLEPFSRSWLDRQVESRGGLISDNNQIPPHKSRAQQHVNYWKSTTRLRRAAHGWCTWSLLRSFFSRKVFAWRIFRLLFVLRIFMRWKTLFTKDLEETFSCLFHSSLKKFSTENAELRFILPISPLDNDEPGWMLHQLHKSRPSRIHWVGRLTQQHNLPLEMYHKFTKQ